MEWEKSAKGWDVAAKKVSFGRGSIMINFIRYGALTKRNGNILVYLIGYTLRFAWFLNLTGS